MPVNRKDYPPNWKSEIVPRILRRDDYRCTDCGVAQYSVGVRFDDGTFYCTEVGTDYAEAGRFALALKSTFQIDCIVVKLAISHSCHDPRCEKDEHLFSRCEYHHNKTDRKRRRANAAKTREQKRTLGKGTRAEDFL